MGALTNATSFALNNYNMTAFQMCPVPTQIDLVQSFMDKSAELQAMLKNLPLHKLEGTPKQQPRKTRRFKRENYVEISFKTAGYILIGSLAAAVLFGTCCVVALT